MLVKCIDTDGFENITEGLLYEVLPGDNDDLYLINDDSGKNRYYGKYLFKVDIVNHSDHYTYKSTECKDIISVMTEGLEGEEAYYMGAIVKYLYRYPKKGKPIEDLNKAKTYIDMIIEKLESEE